MGKIGSTAHLVSVIKNSTAERGDVARSTRMSGCVQATFLPPISTTRRKEVIVVASKNAPVKSILANLSFLVSSLLSALCGTSIQTRRADMAISGA